LSEVKGLDSSLSAFFNNKKNKKNDKESNQFQKLLNSYEKLKPTFIQVTKVQLSDDVYQDYQQEVQKKVQVNSMQLQKPIVDKWTKATVDVELSIAKETRDELIQMESEYDELHEMVRDFNIITKEQGESIKLVKQSMVETNKNVSQGKQKKEK
jgi:D-alanyl-D-alanine dipeptidase